LLAAVTRTTFTRVGARPHACAARRGAALTADASGAGTAVALVDTASDAIAVGSRQHHPAEGADAGAARQAGGASAAAAVAVRATSFARDAVAEGRTTRDAAHHAHRYGATTVAVALAVVIGTASAIAVAGPTRESGGTDSTFAAGRALEATSRAVP